MEERRYEMEHLEQAVRWVGGRNFDEWHKNLNNEIKFLNSKGWKVDQVIKVDRIFFLLCTAVPQAEMKCA